METRLARWITAVLATGLLIVVAHGFGPSGGVRGVRTSVPPLATPRARSVAAAPVDPVAVPQSVTASSPSTTVAVDTPVGSDVLELEVQPISYRTDSEPIEAAPAPLRSVALFGDSLTVAAWDQYQAITAGAVHTEGHRWDGTAITDWRDAILRDGNARLVLALGTNDAERDGAPPWADVLNRLPASTCVVWPKPYEGSNAVRIFNAQMTAIVAAHPNVHVVDWDARVKAHPEWVQPDHKHYVAAGDDAYAEMLKDAALTCP